MTTILTKIRDLILDNLSTKGDDVFTYLTSKIFTLSESNVDSTSILVYRNGVLVSSANYSYSATTNKLTYTGTLVANDSVEIKYSYYTKYSDTELRGYARAALSYLATEKYKTFTCKVDNLIFPTPSEAEENLIAVIASILISGSIRSYRTAEFTINFNEDESKDVKIKKIVRQFNKSYGYLDFIDLTERLANPEEENE